MVLSKSMSTLTITSRPDELSERLILLCLTLSKMNTAKGEEKKYADLPCTVTHDTRGVLTLTKWWSVSPLGKNLDDLIPPR